MKKPAANIALVLFARSASEEACHKKLLPQSPADRQQPVFEAFNASSLALLAATGLPYFLISSADQQGQTFGQRLSRALAQTFARGFGHVIVIGNDCPQLRVRDLNRAADLLGQYGSVLGPNHNGGIYLLGLSKEVFEKAADLEHIAWQTPAVHQQLTACFSRQQSPVAQLAPYADINTPQDFRRARHQRLFRRSLRSVITRLLNLLIPRLLRPEYLLIPIQYQPAALFRGPPVRLS